MRYQNYFVYILTNQRHTVVYIGITNSLERRQSQHAITSRRHFARQYNADKLVYFVYIMGSLGFAALRSG